MESAECGSAEAAQSQNTRFRFAQIVELGNGIASTQWLQGGNEFGRESHVRRRSIIENDVDRVPASVIRRDLWLLLNTSGAVFETTGTRSSVVVNTIGTVGGLAVVSAERGAIGPRRGLRRKTRPEWNLQA